MNANPTEIVTWLRERATAAGARGFVVGLSGGIDSAVVLGLCQQALPGQVIGAIMPCRSDPQDESDARQVATHFGVAAISIALDPVYEVTIEELRRAAEALPPEITAQWPEDESRARVPLVNIMPRLRMTALYFLANSLNYLVAGTSNRSELTIGYFTKYGDGAADLLPIGHLVKSEVRQLARHLEVPQAIIDKTPSAGLWIGQTDEAEMGFKYADLEAYVTEGPEAVPPALALRLERMIRATGHKRALPPTPESHPDDGI